MFLCRVVQAQPLTPLWSWPHDDYDCIYLHMVQAFKTEEVGGRNLHVRRERKVVGVFERGKGVP
jgi:hypothetical protein